MKDSVMLTDLARSIYTANADKGFWPENPRDRNFGEILALIHSEVSELLEASRKGNLDAACDKDIKFPKHYDEFAELAQQDELMTNLEEEAADIIIRVLDLCGAYNVDIDSAIRAKLIYNASRPHKHGKKF